MDYRRASYHSYTWTKQLLSTLSRPPAMIRAHTVLQTYHQAITRRRWSPTFCNDFNLVSYSESQGSTMCTDCWRRIANEATSSYHINLLRDINPIFTYSTSVALPRQHDLSPIPGFSFDHDEIQPIATNMTDFELKWPIQQAMEVSSTRLSIDDAAPGLVPNAMGTELEEYCHDGPLLQEMSSNLLNYSTHPSKDPSIRNLLNTIDQMEHIDDPEGASPTSLKIFDEPKDNHENMYNRPTQNDTRDKQKQPARVQIEQVESTALVGLGQLVLNTPLTMASDSQASNSLVVSPNPNLGSSASYEQYNPKIHLTPSAPWNRTWISGCFFTGLGSNSLGRYAYTNMIFPRRLGGTVHTQTKGCHMCGTFITFARYLAPEIFAIHAGVLAYLEYLEYHLVLRLGVEVIEDNPSLELTISNDLFQITDHYVEDHSTPHWVILHSSSWEEIKIAIIQGMVWSQHWFPHKPGYQLNRTVLYVQLLRYLLMCKVLIFAENMEFGGDRWEAPRSELPRGSIAQEFTYWAGLHLFNFREMCDYGNIRGFIPEANGGMGAFTKEDYNGQHY